MADINVTNADDIQAAINGASSGDKIIFAAGSGGTYNTAFNVNKALELIGAGVGNTIIGDTIVFSHIGSDWTSDFTKMSNIEVNNQKTGDTDYALDLAVNFEYCDVSNCKFTAVKGYVLRISNLSTPTLATNLKFTDCVLDGGNNETGIIIKVPNATSTLNVDFTDCVLQNGFRYGIYAETHPTYKPTMDNWNMTRCTFQNITERSFYVEKLTNSTMTDCTFINCANEATRASNTCIEMSLKFRLDYQNNVFNNITITNSALASSNGGATAVKLSARCEGGTYSLNPAHISGVIFNGTITNSGERTAIQIGDFSNGKDEPSPTFNDLEGINLTGTSMINCPATYSILDNRHYSVDNIDATNVFWNDGTGPGEISTGIYFTDAVSGATATGDGLPISTWYTPAYTRSAIVFDPWAGKAPEYNWKAAGDTPGLDMDTMAGVQRNGNLASGSAQSAVAHNPRLGPTVIIHNTGGYTPSQAAQGIGGGRNASGQIGYKYDK